MGNFLSQHPLNFFLIQIIFLVPSVGAQPSVHHTSFVKNNKYPPWMPLGIMGGSLLLAFLIFFYVKFCLHNPAETTQPPLPSPASQQEQEDDIENAPPALPSPGSQQEMEDVIDNVVSPATPSPNVSPDEAQSGEDQSQSQISAEDEARVSISTFPLKPFSGEGGECSICLEPFKEGELIRVLPSCPHCYHDECIRKWAETGSDHCPQCRQLYAAPAQGLSSPVQLSTSSTM